MDFRPLTGVPMNLKNAAIFFLVFGLSASVSGADQIIIKPVQFAAGANSATVKGTVKGYDSVDYTLTAKAGQTMSVKMTTTNASSYFNVLPPGSTGEAIFIGSSEGNNYSGVLPASGKYTVRVYLMRNAARRNETASYSVSFKITGK
jgi:hypothetical protein